MAKADVKQRRRLGAREEAGCDQEPAPAGGGPARRRRAARTSSWRASLRNEDFKADGLRSYAHYRDLGVKDATNGMALAHVVRFIGHAIRRSSRRCICTRPNSR